MKFIGHAAITDYPNDAWWGCNAWDEGMLMTERPEQEATVANPNVEDMMLIAHAPFILYCDWWKLALQSFSHSCAPRHPTGSTKDHSQLEIPEPLEADGEHFFA